MEGKGEENRKGRERVVRIMFVCYCSIAKAGSLSIT